MTVKIVIKRIVPKDREKELMPLLKQLRNYGMNQSGYISGETLKNVEKPGEYLVISTWQSVEDWKNWMSDQLRIQIQSQVEFLLSEKTEYGIYHYA